MFDYAQDWQIRYEMIWKALSAVNNPSVKNAPAYINRMTRKYGETFKSAVSIAYELKDQHCYAVQVTKIDESLSVKNRWKTIQQFRNS